MSLMFVNTHTHGPWITTAVSRSTVCGRGCAALCATATSKYQHVSGSLVLDFLFMMFCWGTGAGSHGSRAGGIVVKHTW